MEIWHADYNINKKSNIRELPVEGGVFGLFAVIDGKPCNCRYIGESLNIREEIKRLFELPSEEGLKKFMQGPWIKIIEFETLANKSRDDIQKCKEAWIEKYKPSIDEEGYQIGYYEF